MKANSLAIFTRGAQLLAEANTIQKAKELKDMAIIAGEWARRKKAGEDTIQYCRNYALEAERKLGEMLAATERAKGAKGIGPIAVTMGNRNAPTLAELGISKRESAKAQALAKVPPEQFEEVRNGKKSRAAVERAIADAKKPKRRPAARLYIPNPNAAHVPFRKGWKPSDLFPGTDLTYQEKWRRALLNRAGDAIPMRDEDWSMYKADPELVDVATQALEAWEKVVARLKTIL